MATPYKVYDENRKLIGSLMYAEDAIEIAWRTPKSVIKWRGRPIIWRHGIDPPSNGEDIIDPQLLFDRIELWRANYRRPIGE